MVTSIPHWTGSGSIEVAQSRGGVFAVIDPWDNLVRTGITPWPPPEILQKLYESRQGAAFGPDPAVSGAVTGALGFYSDIQSLHSEDALTWSVLGPLVYGDQVSRRAFLDALLQSLGLSSSAGSVHVWLWRRFPHPDTRGMGGPELDFGIQAEDVVVFGEAKWRSGIGKSQGVDRDKDQMQLRHEFLVRFGENLFPACSRFVLLYVGPEETPLRGGTPIGKGMLHHGSLTWRTICQFPHPLSHEIQSYLEWKLRHSKPIP